MSREVLVTERLVLRELTEADAEFVHALVNDPDWVRFIGPRNAATVELARQYLASAYLPMYAKHGYGLWGVARRDDPALLGVCGLIRRDTLDAPDVGFAFLPSARGAGFAREATAACLAHGHKQLGMPRILAICTQDNARSRAVLERSGMRFERLLPPDASGVELCLYASGEAERPPVAPGPAPR
ncbi:MAG: GNAT family N-acetyltransferase [Candidatus Eisenbacteria bacterium]